MFTELMPLLRKRKLYLPSPLLRAIRSERPSFRRRRLTRKTTPSPPDLAITGTPRNPLQNFRHLGGTAPYSRKAIYTTQIHSYSPVRVLLTVPRQVSERGNPAK